MDLIFYTGTLDTILLIFIIKNKMCGISWSYDTLEFRLQGTKINGDNLSLLLISRGFHDTTCKCYITMITPFLTILWRSVVLFPPIYFGLLQAKF